MKISIAVLLAVALQQLLAVSAQQLDGVLRIEHELRYVSLGDSISFSCLTTNSSLVVSWTRNYNDGEADQFIFPTLNRYTLDTTGQNLRIDNVMNIDAADYFCIWSNNTGASARSNPSTLSIFEPPVITMDARFEDNPGADIQIPLQITGNPTPNLTLRREGSQTDVPAEKYAVNTNMLVIHQLSVSDAGSYVLRAEAFDSVTTAEFALAVRASPVVCIHQGAGNGSCGSSTSVKAGGNVTLICNATGSYANNLNLMWKNDDGNEITGVVLSSMELQLTVIVQTSTSYSCMVVNEVGTIEKQFAVEVVSEPSAPANLRLTEDGRISALWDPPENPGGIPITAYYTRVDCDDGNAMSVRLEPTARSFIFYQCGTCQVGVTAENDCGNGTEKVASITCTSSSQSDESSSSSTVIIIGVIVVVMFMMLTVVAIGLFVCWWHRQKHSDSVDPESQKDPVKVNSMKTSISITNSPPPFIRRTSSIRQYRSLLEIPKDNVVLRDILYDGTCVELCKCLASIDNSSKTHEVMVKRVKESAPPEEENNMQEEIKMMSTIGIHDNVVALLRTCSESPVYLITEYFGHGDLLGFLRSSRGHYGMYHISPGTSVKTHPCTVHTQDLLKIATQVAAGMSFLADRRITHRSLCARNVLVGTGLQVKVYNYGQKSNNSEMMPQNYAKWMAPEMLFDGTANILSDVWSFGVTLWEIVTIGGSPYAHTHPQQMRELLQTGYRMSRPEHCATEVYSVMDQCWQHTPNTRPVFSTIHKQLDTMCKSKLSYLDPSLYNDAEYSQFEDAAQLMTAL